MDFNRRSCCGLNDDSYSYSGGIYAIPREWNIVGEWWVQNQCHSGPLIATGLNYGADWICRTTPVQGRQYVRGLSYFFNGSKKRELVADGTQDDCQRANILHLADGSEYDLADLDDAAFSEAVSSPMQYLRCEFGLTRNSKRTLLSLVCQVSTNILIIGFMILPT
jgi:hypothetical protein